MYYHRSPRYRLEDTGIKIFNNKKAPACWFFVILKTTNELPYK